MENPSSVIDNVESLIDNLGSLLKTDMIIGDPIVVDEVTLVPIIDITLGCGSGKGGGKSSIKTHGSGSGVGFGAKVTPNAMVVIKGDDVSLLPIRQELNYLDSLTEIFTMIRSKIKDAKERE